MKDNISDFQAQHRILLSLALHSQSSNIRRVAKGILAEQFADNARKEIVDAVKMESQRTGDA